MSITLENPIKSSPRWNVLSAESRGSLISQQRFLYLGSAIIMVLAAVSTAL